MTSAPEAHLRLGWVLVRRDRHLAAGTAFKRGAGLEPGLASAHEGLGVVLSREKRHAAAEIKYREAARLAPAGTPSSAMAHCRLGESLAAQGRYRDAESANRDAIRADPGLAAATHGTRLGAAAAWGTAEAEQEFKTGIALDASGTEGHLGLRVTAAGRDAVSGGGGGVPGGHPAGPRQRGGPPRPRAAAGQHWRGTLRPRPSSAR